MFVLIDPVVFSAVKHKLIQGLRVCHVSTVASRSEMCVSAVFWPKRIIIY